MTHGRKSWWVPLVAGVARAGSLTWMLVQGQGVLPWASAAHGWEPGSNRGSMMGGNGWGDGSMMRGNGQDRSDGTADRVENLADARTAAEEFARDLGTGLGVGEVMQFDNNFYAEITEANGDLATEALVDPRSGAVQIEYGPARMWNTRYGMMGAESGTTGQITASDAKGIADRWLADQGDGLTADEAEQFPGYYTMHTLRDGTVTGMLSVNSTSGDVWYHTWHGEFVGMTEAQ